MWMYPTPCCPSHPFSAELGDMEINSRVRRVLAHGADLNLGSSPVPLGEGVDGPLVSPLELLAYVCCLLVYTAPTSPVPVLTLKGGAGVIGVILFGSDRLSATSAGDRAMPPRLAVAGGGAGGNLGVGAVRGITASDVRC
jgi:hypothetical protein